MRLPVLYFDEADGPLGTLRIIASDAGLHAVLWDCDIGNHRVRLPGPIHRNTEHRVIAATRRQLGEYFARERTQFHLPLSPAGTPFQRSAWKILESIPYGQTLSYEEQASRLGDPKACRAVGAANGRNPISIIVPCHRVIGKRGGLRGFAGGLSAKADLLNLEKGLST